MAKKEVWAPISLFLSCKSPMLTYIWVFHTLQKLLWEVFVHKEACAPSLWELMSKDSARIVNVTWLQPLLKFSKIVTFFHKENIMARQFIGEFWMLEENWLETNVFNIVGFRIGAKKFMYPPFLLAKLHLLLHEHYLLQHHHHHLRATKPQDPQ